MGSETEQTDQAGYGVEASASAEPTKECLA